MAAGKGPASSIRLTDPPGHLWRDKWTALSGPRSMAGQEGPGPAILMYSPRTCLLTEEPPATYRVCRVPEDQDEDATVIAGEFWVQTYSMKPCGWTHNHQPVFRGHD